MMITQIENPTNASIVVSTEEGKIIIDPWFTDGIYDGTWHNFPRVTDSYKKRILDSVDACLITHLHKDHFDINTLKLLSKETKFVFPKTFGWQVINSNLESNGFKNAIILDFLEDSISAAGFTIKAIPPLNSSGLDSQGEENELSIDGGFTLESNFCELKLVFLADNNLYNDRVVEENLDLLKEPDLIAFAYNGFASDFPFNYNFSYQKKIDICNKNEEVRFSKQIRNLKKIKPRFILPYSSEFVPVGTHVSNWTEIFRNIYTNNKSFVAKKYGETLNCNFGTLYPEEFLRFDNNCMLSIEESYPRSTLLNEMISYQNKMSKKEKESSTFEDEISCKDINYFLLELAAKNCFDAIERNGLVPKSSVNLFLNKSFFVGIDFENMEIERGNRLSEPFLNIYLTPEMLSRLLSAELHWNDACLSMKINWYREPEEFDFDTQNALTYLCSP